MENEQITIKKKRSFKDTLVIIIMIISAIYLINPTAGILEFIPDAMPLVGNIDEGIATTLLLSGLSYFGYNITEIFKRNK